MSEDTNNPLYKLITDSLQVQLVWINVSIRLIFGHLARVLQGSVAPRLRL